MTQNEFRRSTGYGNGFDRRRTLSSSDDGRIWFHKQNRTAARTAPDRRSSR